MPKPTEEETLSKLLESLNDESKTNKNLRIQKWFIWFTTITLTSITLFGYKYSLIPIVWLLFLSGLVGMSLMGLIIIYQIQFQLELLNPYINADAVMERIDVIKKSKVSKSMDDWP